MTKPRILFVDDEPNVLEGLRRMLHRQRKEWELEFATSGAEALSCLREAACDVVVTDMRMPGMDGAQLLAKIADRHPDTIRFILSGYSEKESIMRTVGPAHQFLNKPCDPEILRQSLTSALRLKRQMDNEMLRMVVSRIEVLPSLPELYQQLKRVAHSNTEGMHEAAEIVARDMGMSAKLLQLVNSAFFSIARDVSSVHQAVSLLGLETLKSLVLSESIFRSFTLSRDLPGFSLEAFWEHCTRCGVLARRIVLERTGDKPMAEYAMTAGLLHDLGKLIVAAAFPDVLEHSLNAAQKRGTTLHDIEVERHGFSHAQVGAYLLGLWRLPLPVIEAVAFHHAPGESGCEAFNPTVAVHVANVLDQEAVPGASGNGALPLLDPELLERFELTGHVHAHRAQT